MRRFNVTVNGVSYDVVVEEVGGVSAPAAQAPVAAPVQAPAAAPAPKAAVQGNAGSVAVKAPMPGTILKLNASVGQAVKKGDVLCVLEAMKMENDICAPEDGTVASVNVQKGASVNTDDVLVTLK
jgi:biotin carboxyl carrier protein